MPLVQNIRVGELTERVELQKETHSDDGLGGSESSWETQATVWAQVRALGGNERQHADALRAESTYRVVIYNRSDLDVRGNWRIVWRDRNLNIRNVGYSGPQDMYLVLEAEAGVAS